MIITLTPEGRPLAYVNDPVPEGYQDLMREQGTRFIEMAESDLPGDLFFKYWANESNQLVPRPEFAAVEDVQLSVGDTISWDLPPSTWVAVDEEAPVEIDGTTLEIEADMPAEYTLSFSNWPYVEKTIRVTIHENPAN